ncbi:MAG: tetratricopeptide repeat protein [Syntrophomonas sp.]
MKKLSVNWLITLIAFFLFTLSLTTASSAAASETTSSNSAISSKDYYKNSMLESRHSREAMPYHLALPPESDQTETQSDQGTSLTTEEKTAQAIHTNSIATDYVGQGWTYLNQGKYDQAINSFTTAISNDPYLADAYNGRGWSYYLKGEYDLAITDFSQAIRLDSYYIGAYDGRGWCYFYKEQYNLAIADFSQAIWLDSNYADVYNGRGWCYYYQANYDPAISDFTRAIQLDSESVYQYRGRAWCYEDKGEYALAITDLNKILQLDSNDKWSYFDRAWCYKCLGQYNQAITDYTSIIQRGWSNDWVYYQRGMIYYENLKNYYPAIADFTSAINIDSENGFYYKMRAWCYYNLGQYNNAITDFSSSMQGYYVWDPDAYYGRGWAYYKLNKNSEAIQDFKSYADYYFGQDLQEVPLIDFSLNKSSIDICITDSPKIMTRGGLCRFLANSLGLEDESAASSFSDVSPDNTYYHDISALVQAGKINGYPDGTFHPEWGVSRADYAAIMMHMLGYICPPVTSTSIPDLQGHWAENYASTAVEAGIMSLYQDGTFRPDEYLSLDTKGQLIPLLAPGCASNNKITWSSNNTKVATVDQTGHVDGVSAGQALITATSSEGNLIRTCQVNVTIPEIASTISVVIDNYKDAQPQAGLNDADLVFEAPVAPDITRFLAIFDLLKISGDKKIGPVRSARSFLAILANNYSTGFAHAGGSNEALQMIPQLPIIDLDEIYGAGQYFYRSSDRQMPYNLYTGTELLRQAMSNRGGTLVSPTTQFTLGDMTGGEFADRAVVKFTDQSNGVGFKWNGQSYERYQNGNVALLEDGSPITTTNLAIIYTQEECVFNNNLNEWVTDVNIEGTGEASFYRDGKLWKGTWQKTNNSKINFTVKGQTMKFAPGSIWILIVPDKMPPVVLYNPPGGQYSDAQSVSLINSKSGKIYYTANGQDPTSSSTEYLSPISIASTTTLKSIAIDKAGNQSGVYSEVYNVNSPPTADTKTPEELTINSVIGDDKLVGNDVVTLRFNQLLENSNGEAKASIILALASTAFANKVNVEPIGGENSDTSEFKLVVIPGETVDLTSNNAIRIVAGSIKNINGLSNNTEVNFTVEDKIDECFIATAAFGSKFEPCVALLRNFRDQYLLTNSLGTMFVNFYYHNSPSLARFIAGNKMLKALTRTLLLPVVGVVYLVFHPGYLIGVFLLILIGLFSIKWIRGQIPNHV